MHAQGGIIYCMKRYSDGRSNQDEEATLPATATTAAADPCHCVDDHGKLSSQQQPTNQYDIDVLPSRSGH